MTVEELNRLPEPEARATLERCCGSAAWVARMCASRPFADLDHVFREAERAGEPLRRDDWLEAFAHHPRIGDVEALRERFAGTATWASEEQRGASSGGEAMLAALAEGNRAYEEKFGYIFIVCATGKSADEMLALLRARLPHDPESELPIAAGEQMKITRIRLAKLLGGSS
jgi:2-oxo-4-hydroxy-4-carboxy-5-ureidoimidazoline decarboxylase